MRETWMDTGSGEWFRIAVRELRRARMDTTFTDGGRISAWRFTVDVCDVLAGERAQNTRNTKLLWDKANWGTN